MKSTMRPAREVKSSGPIIALPLGLGGIMEMRVAFL